MFDYFGFLEVHTEKFKEMVLWYKSVDLLKIKERSNPKEFYQRIMELAEEEAAEFSDWDVSMKQEDHKDWFRGMYIARKIH